MTDSDRIPGPRGCGNNAAPYVLGALEPTEARAFVAHMQRCPVCRDEVAALTLVVDLVPASVPRYPIRRALRRRVMAQVRSEPKRSNDRPRFGTRWWRHRTPALGRPDLAGVLASLVALASMVALAVVGVGVSMRGSHGAPARVIQASVGSAQLRIAGGRGELIVDHLPPAPPDRVYELWLQRGARPPAPSTLFAVTSRGTADLGLPGDVTGVTRVMVTVEPVAGSRVPTTRAVIVARV
jgi:hypothetical protein